MMKKRIVSLLRFCYDRCKNGIRKEYFYLIEKESFVALIKDTLNSEASFHRCFFSPVVTGILAPSGSDHVNVWFINCRIEGPNMADEDPNDSSFLWNWKTFCSLRMLQWPSYPSRWSLSNWLGSSAEKKKIKERIKTLRHWWDGA